MTQGVAQPEATLHAPTTNGQTPTIWGLDPVALHARFWASRGVQVVRLGEPSEIVKHAELFLLLDPRTLSIFRLTALVDRLNWLQPDLLFVRLREARERGYREIIHANEQGRFARFERDYGSADGSLARVALTPDRDLARVWQSATEPREGWRHLRRTLPRELRSTMSVEGHVYDRDSKRQTARFVRDLVSLWGRPDATIDRVRGSGSHVWVDTEAHVESGAKFTGPVWIGAGREVGRDTTAVGPAVMWDSPQAKPTIEDIRWLELEPSEPPTDPAPRRSPAAARAFKRGFDIVFSLVALGLTLPLYPFIALAIVIEDGWPIFFAHRRETIGGREFPCIKFRSMRRNAEDIKAELSEKNLADGPQFYIDNDPRMTRVGAILRAYQLDELPQFINVLLGDMSIVGPRPSPYKENQFCPAWREARLSVRPGVTGLWQIKRTRATGADFQEWIKYDIEYVENASFRLDLYVIWKTIALVLRGVTRS
jgi:lipopolysaccharide/colanic/teichoic acid biosynthesis glycosyltransferase